MPGTGVHDMVKPAEVSLAPGPHPVTDRAALDPAQGVYIRNQLPGTVTDVATVKIPVKPANSPPRSPPTPRPASP
ncbi:hypothetical protein ACIQJT_09155 [Streptomyces sp. NPDC091972]|uniref:hypothetical protein n=1 Tax=Streptomyces sp. NPDC091972 TaxID=3366007 RepID=UPI0037FD6EBC